MVVVVSVAVVVVIAAVVVENIDVYSILRHNSNHQKWL